MVNNHRIFFCIVLTCFLSGCGNIVKNFDNKLSKRYNDQGFSAESIDENGHHITYWDNKKENAPVIVFVHGFGGDGKISWLNQAFEFQKNYRVIVPDILWFGNSHSSKKPALSTQIHAIRTLIQELELSDVNLCGISYGGFIVLGYANKYHLDLKSLCIVDSPGSTITDEEISDFCKSVEVDDVKEAFVPENGKDVKRLLKFSFNKPPLLPNFIRKQTIGIYFSKHPQAQRDLLEELPSNRSTMSGETKIPTLILWGKEDQVFKVDNAHELQKEIGAELTVFEKAGHALPEEKHEAFNSRYQTFLNNN